MNSHGNTNAPANGDFAAYLEGRQNTAAPRSAQPAAVPENTSALSAPRRTQSVEDVLVHGEEPTDEFLEEWNEIQNAPGLSDEELARQALSAPGDDGDPNTPE